VRDQLAIRGPMLIWIDEMQHVVDGLQSNDDIKKMLNTIKSIVQLQVWPPISLVMSGLPMLSDFTKMDSQINRRTREVAFDIIRLPDDLDDVQDVIQCTIADDVGLGVAPELTTGEFAARLCHATSKALGLVISLTRAAAVQAYGGERDVVCINDYAIAYHEATGRPAAENPFLVSAWADVRPWYADCMAQAAAAAATSTRKRKAA